MKKEDKKHLGWIAEAMDKAARDAQQRQDEPGKKWDGGKIRLDLLPVEAIEAVGRIYTQGATEYGDRNWEKGMSWGRLFAAALRHIFAFWRGEDTDAKSGQPHLAHAAWNVLGLLQYFLTRTGTDDRPKREKS
jgi:hypothetical protein